MASAMSPCPNCHSKNIYKSKEVSAGGGHAPDYLPGLGKFLAARDRLRACPTLKTDPAKGIGPTVEFDVNGSQGEYRDVVVRVVERPGGWVGQGITDMFWYGLQFLISADDDALDEFNSTLAHTLNRLFRDFEPK